MLSIFSNRLNLAVLAWIAMFLSILIWTPPDLKAGELGDSSNYYRIILVLFAASAAMAVLLRNAARIEQTLSGPLLLLLFYGVVAMVSSAYVPAFAFYSMWKGFEVVVDVLVIAAVLSYAQPLSCARSAYRMLLVLNGVLVLVYLVEALVWPTEAMTSTRGTLSIYLQGVLPVMSQNALAFLSAMVAFAVLCRLYRPGRTIVKIAYLPMLCLSLMTLLFAQSRTSVIALALAVVLYLLLDRRYISLSILLAVCVVAALYTQAVNVSFQYLLRGQDEALVTSLSGRTEGWEAAWESFKEAPITGRGFAAYARANILGFGGFSSLHGAVFDVLVGTGMLGFLPWAAAILWTLVRLWTLPWSGSAWFRSIAGRSVQAEMLGVMVLILVRASTSSGLAMHQDNFMLFLTVLAYVSAMRVTLRADATSAGLAHAAAG